MTSKIIIHYIDSKGWYACNHAVGNGIRGVASRNWKKVTCKNCLKKKPIKRGIRW